VDDAIDLNVVQALSHVRNDVLLIDITVHGELVTAFACLAEFLGKFQRRIILFI